MKKLFLMLLAVVGFTMQANAITLTVVSGDKNDPSNGEGCQKLVDGNWASKWGDGISEGQTKYVVVKSNVAITPFSYVLVTGNDTGNFSGRNWNVWKVYAGNFASDADAARDAEGWVLIDQRADVAGTDQLPAANSEATPPFVLTETVTDSYLYYKIEIEACKDLNTYMQMGEFFFDKYTVDMSAFAEPIAAVKAFDYKASGNAYLEGEYETLLQKIDACEDPDEMDKLLMQAPDLQKLISSIAEVKKFDYKVAADAELEADFEGVIEGLTAATSTEAVEKGIAAAQKLQDVITKEVTAVIVAFDGCDGTWPDGHWSNFVDGDMGTKWGGGKPADGAWMIFRVKGGIQPYAYRLITGGDTQSYPSRNWATWTVYGGNFKTLAEAVRGAEGWVALDVRENAGQDLFPALNLNPTTFDFTEGVKESYSYFLVDVTSMYDNGGDYQMTEFQFVTKEEVDGLKDEFLKNYENIDLTANVEPWHQADKDHFVEIYEKLKETTNILELGKLNNTLASLKAGLEATMTARADQENRYMNGGYLPLAGNTAWGEGENWARRSTPALLPAKSASG